MAFSGWCPSRAVPTESAVPCWLRVLSTAKPRPGGAPTSALTLAIYTRVLRCRCLRATASPGGNVLLQNSRVDAGAFAASGRMIDASAERHRTALQVPGAGCHWLPRGHGFGVAGYVISTATTWAWARAGRSERQRQDTMVRRRRSGTRTKHGWCWLGHPVVASAGARTDSGALSCGCADAGGPDARGVAFESDTKAVAPQGPEPGVNGGRCRQPHRATCSVSVMFFARWLGHAVLGTHAVSSGDYKRCCRLLIMKTSALQLARYLGEVSRGLTAWAFCDPAATRSSARHLRALVQLPTCAAGPVPLVTVLVFFIASVLAAARRRHRRRYGDWCPLRVRWAS